MSKTANMKPLFQIAAYTLLVLWGVFCLLPTYWMVTNSFKDISVMLKFPPEWFPSNPSLGNFEELVNDSMALAWAGNSLFISSTVTLLVIFLCSFYGYVFAKWTFIGRELIFWLIISTMMVPFQVIIIPLFLIMMKYRMLNTYWALILPGIFSPFGIFLMRQFIKTLPTEIIEAAKIEGCPNFGIYWRIILPLSKPGLAVLGIFTYMAQWNNFLWPLVVLNELKMYTLPVGLATLQLHAATDYGLLMAGATFAALPMFIVFFIFQRYFLRGITVGALKG